jgi:hypothetical protein
MTATATVEVSEARRLRPVWSAPETGGARPRFAATRGRVLPRSRTTMDWDGYVADLRRQLDEVHAKLSFAERQMPRTPGLTEPAARERPEAAVRVVRERWTAAEGRLEELRSTGSPPPPRPMLEALGRERGRVDLGGRTIELSRRHTEILVLLAGHPEGMTTERLAIALYGDMGRPASVRTELCRLRKGLAKWIHSEGNLLKLDIDADFLEVQRLLREGRTREAAEAYRAPLLPRSEAPGIVHDRTELDAWVRSAVMTAEDREALWAWLDSESGGDDVPAWKRFLADLDFADPRRAFAVSRLSRLRTTLALVG